MADEQIKKENNEEKQIELTNIEDNKNIKEEKISKSNIVIEKNFRIL